MGTAHCRSASAPPAQLEARHLASLGLSEGTLLQGSPTLPPQQQLGPLAWEEGETAAGHGARRPWPPASPGSSGSEDGAVTSAGPLPPAPAVQLPPDRELAALGFTPAPLARNLRKQSVRASGGLVQETPAPLARGAGLLGRTPPASQAPPAIARGAPYMQRRAAGGWLEPGGTAGHQRVIAEASRPAAAGSSMCSSGESEADPRPAAGVGLLPKGRETALQPLGGGLRKCGGVGMHPSPSKAPPQSAAHAAAALPPSLLPGGRCGSALPGRLQQQQQGQGPSACAPAAIPPPPRALQTWSVGEILQDLKQRAAKGMPSSRPGAEQLWQPAAAAAERQGAGWGAAGCAAGGGGWALPQRRGEARAAAADEGAAAVPAALVQLRSSHGSCPPSPVRFHGLHLPGLAGCQFAHSDHAAQCARLD